MSRLLSAVLLVSLLPFLPLPEADAAANNKRVICHRTKATKNPYRKITVASGSVNSLTSGHHLHGAEGDVWTSSDVNGGSWGDIIPPNNGGQKDKNWTTAGQAIYNGQVFVSSTGLPACRGMSLKAYVDAQRAAGVSDSDIVTDLNDNRADEDVAILNKTGETTFSISNLTTVANASVAISATTSAASGVSTSGATLNGSFKTDATTTYWYFEYNRGDSTFADAPSTTTCTALGATNSTASKSASASSLTSNSKYYFRAVIVDNCSTPTILIYGDIYSFTTSSTTYRVTYDPNGGSGSVPTDPNVYVSNDVAYIYGNSGGLTKSGAVFKHWATSPAGSALRASSSTSTLLRASPDIKVLGSSSSKWTFLKAKTRIAENYAYSSGDNLTVTGNTTLYAIYETAYTVTYYGNTNSSGSAPTDSTSYANNSTVTVLGNTGTLAKSGYSFGGWCTTQPAAGSACGGTSRAADSTFTITGNVSLYAVWTANTNNPIVYDNQGATTSQIGGSTTYTTGSSISTIPTTAPLKTGYQFVGWFTASSGGTQVTNGSYTPSSPYGSVTLYAQWTGNQYVYDGNTNDGGSVPASQTYAGSTLSARTNTFTKTGGYSFYGWCLTQETPGTNCRGTKYNAGNALPTPNSATVTLYAVWTNATTYQVTYFPQGGSSVDPTTFLSGDSIALPSAPTRNGYTFNGWYDSSSGGTKVGDPASTYGPLGASNVSLYAQWTINQYTVTYNSNGSDSGTPPSTATINYNDSHTVLTKLDLVKNGYTFGYWHTQSNGTSGTSYSPNDTFTVTANVILYAIWIANSYQIQYDGNSNSSGTVPSNQDKIHDTALTLRSNSGSLLRTGYTFAGWNTLANGTGTNYNESSSYTANVAAILYAKWTANSLTVTYDSQGGSSIASGTTTTGGAISSSPGTPTRDGYTFNGWFVAASGGSAITFAYTHGQTANFTLYAQWTANAPSGGGSSAPAAPPPPPGPRIDSVSKPQICSLGNDIVISGNYFDGGKVTLDGTALTFKSLSSTSISLSMPRAAGGDHTIQITTPNGSATVIITYVDVPKPKFVPILIPYMSQGEYLMLPISATNTSSYAIDGKFPSGLNFDPSTGVISGTPLENGIFGFLVTATGICGETSIVLELDIDKETPNAISHRINILPGSSCINDAAKASLMSFLDKVKELAPRNLMPEIYFSGGGIGSGSDLGDDRRDCLCELFLEEEVYGNVIEGEFTGTANRIEIIVYWPKP